MPKRIRIPSRTINEVTSPIEQVLILPLQAGRVIVSTKDGQQFETTLDATALARVFGWAETAVTAKYADAVVEDVPG